MDTRDPVRVLVADDHTIVREGIVRILRNCEEIEVVGEASDGAEATRKALETRPDVVVMDLSLPRLSGLEATRRIREALPQTRILVLTMHDEDEYIVGSVRAGVSGYLLKDEAPLELLPGIRALKDGKCYFAPSTFQALARACRARLLDFADSAGSPRAASATPGEDFLRRKMRGVPHCWPPASQTTMAPKRRS